MDSTGKYEQTVENRGYLEILETFPSDIKDTEVIKVKAGIEQGSRVLSFNKIVNGIAKQKFGKMNKEQLTKGISDLIVFITAKEDYYNAEDKNVFVKFARLIAKGFSEKFGTLDKGQKLLDDMFTRLIIQIAKDKTDKLWTLDNVSSAIIKQLNINSLTSKTTEPHDTAILKIVSKVSPKTLGNVLDTIMPRE